MPQQVVLQALELAPTPRLPRSVDCRRPRTAGPPRTAVPPTRRERHTERVPLGDDLVSAVLGDVLAHHVVVDLLHLGEIRMRNPTGQGAEGEQF